MSRVAVHWALQATEGGQLPPTAALLLIVLADYHTHKRGCFPSQERLSKRLGVTERHLRQMLRVLVEAGLVKIRALGRRNFYELQMAEQPKKEVKNTGSIVPVFANLCSNTGSIVPVNSGSIVPVSTPKTPQYRKYSSGGVNREDGSKKNRGVLTSKKVFEQETPMPNLEDVLREHEKSLERSPEEVLTAFTAERTRRRGEVTPKMLTDLWRDLVAVHHKRTMTLAATTADMAQMHKAYKLAGEPFLEALPMVIRDWAWFTRFVRDATGSKSPCTIPQIRYVLGHVQSVVQYAEQAKRAEAAMEPAEPVNHLTNVTETLDDEELPASREEALAILKRN